MKVIPVVESRLERLRICGIACDGVVVRDCIERAAGANPSIHGLTSFFTFLAVIGRAFIRCQRVADDFDSVRVRPLDHLFGRGDQLVGCDCSARCIRSRGLADIVDAFHDEEPSHAGLAQHITIEARQSIHTCAVHKNAISRDPFVQ